MEDAVRREPVHTKPHPFANLLQNRLSRTRAACPGPCPSGVIDVAADSRHEALASAERRRKRDRERVLNQEISGFD